MFNFRKKNYSRLINCITGNFNLVYSVNMADDSYTVMRTDAVMAGFGLKFKTFSQFREHVLNNVVTYTDHDKMVEELDFDVIRTKLKNVSSYSLEFRSEIDGMAMWNEMNVTSLGGDDILLAISDKLHCKLGEIISFSNYFLDTYLSAYYIGLDDHSCQTYKKSQFLDGKYPISTNYFDALVQYINNDVRPQDRSSLLDLLCPERMKAILAERPEYTHVFSDISEGQEKLYRLQVVRGSDSSHAAIGFIDISNELKEKKLREEQERQNDNMKKLIGRFSKDYQATIVVNTNNDTYRVLGKSQSKITVNANSTFSESFDKFLPFIHEEDRKELKQTFDLSTLRAKIKEESEFSIRFRNVIDGLIHWNMVRVSAIDDEQAIIAFADIDSTVAHEMAHKAVSSNCYGIYLVDIDTDTVKVVKQDEIKDNSENELQTLRHSEMFGFLVDMLSEKDKANIAPFIDAKEFRKFLKNENKREILFDKPKSDGRLARLSVYAIERKNGEVQTVCATYEDLDKESANSVKMSQQIAQQKVLLEKQQKQLEEALSMSQSANRAKTAFLNNMSHDIRTPMNAIIGFTGLAKSHMNDQEKANDYLEKITQSSNHLLSLINDVLDMSRIESGKMNIEANPENLADIARTIGDLIQADVQAKQQTFSLETSGIMEEMVECDKLRLNQILLNLLSNAIKYTPAGGTIALRINQQKARKGYGKYVFTVQDNGMGMSKEFLKTIFDPFTRVQSSTMSGIQGTGLGMAITKNLIDMMGGAIDIESELGKGTSISVKLTFKLLGASKETVQEEQDASETGSNEMPAETETFRLDGRKILLVEDNELNHEIACTILEEYGCIVTAAQDGQMALDMITNAKDGDFDLVLMDIQMPVMDGYEATRRIRSLGTAISKIPIIAMTANAFEEDHKAALEAGMDDHIAKPIDIDQLNKVLAKFLK